ncbi:MAG: hypothetical protein V4467_03490 [Patescibacteria group bacterium]
MSDNQSSQSRGDQDIENSLEDFKKNLYSRRKIFSKSEEDTKGGFKRHDVADVPKDWGGSGVPETGFLSMRSHQTRWSFLKRLFVISIIFFVISVGVAVYMVLGGANVVSSNNVDISIVGPVSIPGGEILPLEISVTNQNNADLETADLVIDYPDGTRQPVDVTTSLKRYREAFGVVPKGKVATKKVSAVLFGEAGDLKVITVSVEYRLKGSNAIFSKKKEYSVSISSSPVIVTVDSVKEINANQDTEFTVTIVSNSSTVIKQLALNVDYPFGFTFASASPTPSWSNSFWQLGDIKPGIKKVIKLKGKIVGQDNDDRVFRFSVGTENPVNENQIGTNFLTTTKKITLRKPFIGAAVVLDGDNADVHVAQPGKTIRTDLTLSNNIGVRITDVQVSAKLTGNIFDNGSVSPDGGFYQTSGSSIVWDQTLRPGLAALNPDDTTNLSFSFGTLPEQEIRLIKNPQMSITITITGKRPDDSGVSQQITSTITKSIRLTSSLGFSARALYYSGAINNTGPIPPKVGSPTTYTLVWSLTNSLNDVSNVKVSAIIPSYVKWVGLAVPQGEKISYNPVGGQVVWDVGDLKAGSGFSESPREISFQVSITPELSQVGTTPTLLTGATATGDDAFAATTLQADSSAAITTNLTTDIGFKEGQGKVTK